MSRPQRKRRLKRAAKLRRFVRKLVVACNSIGAGFTYAIGEAVMRKRTGAVYKARKGWSTSPYLQPGTIAVITDPDWHFGHDIPPLAPLPPAMFMDIHTPKNHANFLLATRILTA